MNILVTGGAGFIGANFIHYLLKQDRSDHVINFDALTYAGNLNNLDDIKADPHYQFVKGDIADRSAVEAVFDGFNINAVVNFAAESHVDRSILNPAAFIHSNFDGVGVLLAAAKKFNVDKFVQISTDEVYGSSLPHQQFSESAPLNPSSPYSATKASADLLALSYFKTHNLNVSITRSANNYGPYQFPEKLIPLMVTHGLQEKSLPIYGNGQNRRDWLHVQDNCAAIAAVLKKGRAGEVYNIAAHQYKTNNEIVEGIIRQLQLPESRIEYASDRPANDQLYSINDDKIRNELGWRPRIEFDVGMNETIAWYVDHETWWRPLLRQVKNR